MMQGPTEYRLVDEQGNTMSTVLDCTFPVAHALAVEMRAKSIKDFNGLILWDRDGWVREDLKALI